MATEKKREPTNGSRAQVRAREYEAERPDRSDAGWIIRLRETTPQATGTTNQSTSALPLTQQQETSEPLTGPTASQPITYRTERDAIYCQTPTHPNPSAPPIFSQEERRTYPTGQASRSCDHSHAPYACTIKSHPFLPRFRSVPQLIFMLKLHTPRRSLNTS